MLVSGAATATVTTTPQSIAASEGDDAAYNAEEYTDEDSAEEESEEEEVSADYDEEEPVGEEVASEEEVSASEIPKEEEPETPFEEDASSEAADSETASSTESAEWVPIDEDNQEETDENTSDPGTEADSDAESVVTNPEEGVTPAPEEELSEEEKKALEEAALAEQEALAEKEAAEREQEEAEAREKELEAELERERKEYEEQQKLFEEQQKAISDANREAVENARLRREEELKLQEEEAKAEAERKKAEEKEKEAEQKKKEQQELFASYVRGYASSGRTYYTGTYFVSEAQKRLSLNLGFKQVAKRYAVPKDGYVNIREGRNEDSRIVGILEEGSLCYVLEDDTDAWVFVESGDVRGFVKTDLILMGDEVDQLVGATGEEKMKLASQKIDPLDNQAYRYTLTTTRDVSALMSNIVNSSVSRDAVVQFAKQFIGNPYVWGGNSLTNGTDCSGFTQQVYAHFGISIPRVSYEQAESGVKIPVSEAKPGDLIFYAKDGVVYHVVVYAGDGKAVNASTTTTGIILSNVDYDRACWACRFIDDSGAVYGTSTQASQLVATGRQAYDGDAVSQAAIIEALAKASEKEWKEIGFCRSVLIAQTIEESGWLAFHNTGSGIQAIDNNVLGMNADLLNDRWISPWTGASISRLVPQYVNGQIVYDFEDMRVYQDIEACMVDYAAFKIGLHPELRGVNDVDAVIDIGLRGYATNPNYQSNIRRIIDLYNLTQYDIPFEIDEDETIVNGTGEETVTPDSTAEETPEFFPDSTAEDMPEIAPDSTPEEIPEGAEETSEASDEAYDEDPETVSDDVADTVYVDDSDDEDALPAPQDTEGAAEVPETDAAEDAAPADVYDETQAQPEKAAAKNATAGFRIDTTNYTQAQLELIWAIVAEEDDISYDGALAVISSVMNRADQNYGGFGTTAYDQLTADGQYCYSPIVADPIFYQRRLGGNVPDFVKQAVEDCLKAGIRSHRFNSFSASGEEAESVLIGSNWYFDQVAPEEEFEEFYDEEDEVYEEGYEDEDYVFADDSAESDEDAVFFEEE